MTGIIKRFGPVTVLDGVDFELCPGEVHALAGENGAGKSTLMKILQGVHRADAGRIRVAGEVVDIGSTRDAQRAGIGMVFQEFSLVPSLTVAQNIFLGREPRRRGGLIDDTAMTARAHEVLALMGVDLDPGAEVESLSTAYWQLTEIAKALAQDARVLIMDEPTASLSAHETEALFALIRRLTDRGMSVIYISHRMEEIYRITDRITVLRDGRRALTAPVRDLQPDDIVEAIIGRRLENALQWTERAVDRTGTPLLEVRGLTCGARVRDVSFTVHRGEILGLAGLMGSGRTELARTLFGVDPADAGEILLDGEPVPIRNPRSAMAAGLALVPEDRRAQGLVLDHSIRHNLLLPQLDGLRRGGLVDDRRGRRTAADLLERLQVRGACAESAVRTLSGGNQQKVVIGKWVGTDPRLLILDEPTAGVDIGTKQEIVELIRALADSGKAVIIISSELSELLAVSDRVLILRGGGIESDIPRRDIADEESLQLAIQGV
ncbi:sugar ABC transporter ATP-binding protein [Streptomyces purpurogeneiscleroticus]|nr:sugar ABC transporter ATP-binding protein [Streptomyces purpurogeneiscleroticus]